MQAQEANEDVVKRAMEKLGIDEGTARETCAPVPGVDGAFFFSRGIRGGGRVIVDGGLETLFAASSVSTAEHVQAYLQGRRS